MTFHKSSLIAAFQLVKTALTGLYTVEQLRDQHALSGDLSFHRQRLKRQVASRWRTKQDLPWRIVVKHIVVLSALIMTSTLAHAGVMPEDLMLPAVEATTEIAEQVVIEKPTFEEQLNGFMHFVVMSLLVLI